MFLNLDRYLAPITCSPESVSGGMGSVENPSDLERILADRWGLNRQQVCVGSTLLPALFSALVQPEQRVVLAAPTFDDVLDVIPTTGCRYIDVGRNHRFAVDVQGWSTALQAPASALAYVASPDLPTSTVVEPRVIQMAIDAGLGVVIDVRGRSDHCGGSQPPSMVPDVLELGLVGGGAGGEVGAVQYVVGPVDRVARIRDSLAECVASSATIQHAFEGLQHADSVNKRLAQWRRWTQATTDALSELHPLDLQPPQGPAIWVRIPGVASSDIAARIDHEAVIGRDQWTWRDAVAVVPMPPGEALSRLVDAFRSAL
jgi:histidinol-phosphate/aromatic aminotransferase/cobyric acid decarboxylase-like protein